MAGSGYARGPQGDKSPYLVPSCTKRVKQIESCDMLFGNMICNQVLIEISPDRNFKTKHRVATAASTNASVVRKNFQK